MSSTIINKYIREHIYNIGYYLAGAPDGLPIPPARLIFKAIGSWEVSWYLLGGMYAHQGIISFLRKNNINVEGISSLLDFGCGCGRLTRYWSSLKGKTNICGVDRNVSLINWCSKRFAHFASFAMCSDNPPLLYDDDSFDFIYSYSVFTHIRINSQLDWMKEVARIARPGGNVLITTHGRRKAEYHLNHDEYNKLKLDGIYAQEEELSGDNRCVIIHGKQWLQENMQGVGLKLVDFHESGTRDGGMQDVSLYIKK